MPAPMDRSQIRAADRSIVCGDTLFIVCIAGSGTIGSIKSGPTGFCVCGKPDNIDEFH
jgi:hypothetical protein